MSHTACVRKDITPELPAADLAEHALILEMPFWRWLCEQCVGGNIPPPHFVVPLPFSEERPPAFFQYLEHVRGKPYDPVTERIPLAAIETYRNVFGHWWWCFYKKPEAVRLESLPPVQPEKE